MKLTPQTTWDNAPEGQAFATWWRGDDLDNDSNGTIWIKGEVSDLDWDTLIWIAPIDIGEKVYSW